MDENNPNNPNELKLDDANVAQIKKLVEQLNSALENLAKFKEIGVEFIETDTDGAGSLISLMILEAVMASAQPLAYLKGVALAALEAAERRVAES